MYTHACTCMFRFHSSVYMHMLGGYVYYMYMHEILASVLCLEEVSEVYKIL